MEHMLAYRVTFGNLPETRKSMPCFSSSAPYGRWNRSARVTSYYHESAPCECNLYVSMTHISSKELRLAEDHIVRGELRLKSALEALDGRGVGLAAVHPAHATIAISIKSFGE